MSDTRSAAQIAAEAMEGLDDSLQPVKKDGVVVEEDKDVVDTGSDNKSDSGSGSGDDKSDKKDDEDKGYSIDEVEGDEDEKEEKSEPEKPQAQVGQFTPEQQFIVDNLPQIKVRGVVGDSDKVQEFSVYDPRQLPEGFKYLNDRDHDIAQKDFNLIEKRANELQQEFRSQETAKAQKSFTEQEEKADWDDIAALQRSGELPLFKVRPDDKDFDSDETAQLIEKVLDFKDEINKRHLEVYQAGGPYRHIGFEDAYNRYIRANPPKKDDKQAQEDKERQELARRTRGTNSSEVKNTGEHPILRNKQDIDTFIDNLDW